MYVCVICPSHLRSDVLSVMKSMLCKVRRGFFTTESFSLMPLTDYAINNKLTPFISMQNHHSLLYREEEREMFPTMKVCFKTLPYFTLVNAEFRLQLFGVGCIPWSPLARGLLTRPLSETSLRGGTDG